MGTNGASRPPWAPLLLTFLLLLALAIRILVWFVPGESATLPPAVPNGAMRILSWDLRQEAGDGDRPADGQDVAGIVAVLREVGPQVAALQSLSSHAVAEEIAEALGDGWQAVATPSHADGQSGYTAVLLGPAVERVSRNLVEGPGGWSATATTVRTPGRRLLHVISVGPTPAAQRSAFASHLLQYVANQSEDVIILAAAEWGLAADAGDGPPGPASLTPAVQRQLRATMATGVPPAPRDATAGGVWLSPPGAGIRGAAVLGVRADIEPASLPVALDLDLP
jgi:hypothetical protein